MKIFELTVQQSYKFKWSIGSVCFITLILQVFTPMINIGVPCDIILKLIIPIISLLQLHSVGTNSRDILLTAIQHPQYGIKFQIKFVMHHLELYLAKN